MKSCRCPHDPRNERHMSSGASAATMAASAAATAVLTSTIINS